MNAVCFHKFKVLQNVFLVKIQYNNILFCKLYLWQHYKKRKSFKAKRCRNTLPEVISRIVCNFHEEKNLLFLHGSIVSKLLSFEVKEDLNIRVAKQAGTVFRYCRRLRVFLQRLTMYMVQQSDVLMFWSSPSLSYFSCVVYIFIWFSFYVHWLITISER